MKNYKQTKVSAALESLVDIHKIKYKRLEVNFNERSLFIQEPPENETFPITSDFISVTRKNLP
jgi:hypothetical protein